MILRQFKHYTKPCSIQYSITHFLVAQNVIKYNLVTYYDTQTNESIIQNPAQSNNQFWICFSGKKCIEANLLI